MQLFKQTLMLCCALLLLVSVPLMSQDTDEAVELDPNCMGKDEAFAPYFDVLSVSCDDEYMLIEADSLADHDMMIGITAWNQQVPLPQDFSEDNAWRIPMNPVIVDETSPTVGQGPIAVAINGVMIYNPTQQDGTYDEDHDPYLIGELDTCGGHSGRADDYHYHVAPNCIIEALIETSAPDQPIAYALDGFPIYGYDHGENTTVELDECGGEYDADGNYHYHAQPEFPYVNGCFSGVFDVSLQPATHPIRPAGEPIQVLITDYYEGDDGYIHLEYDYQGQSMSINYRETDENCYEFQFVSGDETLTETYCGNIAGDNGNRPPPPDDENNRPPPPKDD